MALGEARSKCEHIAGVPLPPLVAGELHRVYLAKGAHATTAIEGNTLTEEEVRQRMQGKLKLPESREYLGQEVDNVVNACNQMLNLAATQRDFELITPDIIKEFNRIVLNGLELDDEIKPGEISLHNVGVANYLGAPREDCEYLLDRMCSWLNEPAFLPSNNPDAMVFGILRAILAHLYLVWIHPFGDGNGRTSRLLEHRILLAAGVPSPASHLLSNHYNATRTDYYRQLDRSSKGGGDSIPFVEYAVRGFVDGLMAQLQHIRQVQWQLTWVNYVHEVFRGRDSVADRRQKHLVLDMSERPNRSLIHEIPMISPRVAAAYAGKSSRTIRRDIMALIDMDLIVRDGPGFSANRELIQAFLPLRRVYDEDILTLTP
jgi:Fic family protein